MQTAEISKALDTWPQMASMIYVPRSEEAYEQLVRFLDSLIDEVGEDESHPLASLIEIVGILIQRYEDEHVPELSE